MRFGERIILLTGGDVLLYGPGESNAAVIGRIRMSLRTSCPVLIERERERDLELDPLIEYQNRYRIIWDADFTSRCVVFDPATHESIRLL